VLARRPGWVAEEPEGHLTPHLRGARMIGLRVLECTAGEDGILDVAAERDRSDSRRDIGAGHGHCWAPLPSQQPACTSAATATRSSLKLSLGSPNAPDPSPPTGTHCGCGSARPGAHRSLRRFSRASALPLQGRPSLYATLFDPARRGSGPPDRPHAATDPEPARANSRRHASLNAGVLTCHSARDRSPKPLLLIAPTHWQPTGRRHRRPQRPICARCRTWTIATPPSRGVATTGQICRGHLIQCDGEADRPP
jgi:hypothetical protein